MACNAYLLACNVCKHDPNFIGQANENVKQRNLKKKEIKQANKQTIK